MNFALNTKMSTKNIFISIFSVIIIIGGAIWLARPDKNQNQENNSALEASALTAIESNFDFGEISMAKGKISHIFKIKNNTSESIVASKLYTSCMCTEASLIKADKKVGPFGMPGHGFVPKINETIAAGEEAEIEVVFDPSAHGPSGVGPIERVVYLEQEGKNPLEITIKASVTP